MCLCLAYHIVVIEGFASIADEVGSAEEGSGAGTDFFDLGDGVREGGCVDEHLLVKSKSGVNCGQESRAYGAYLGCRAAIVAVLTSAK